MNVRCHTPNVRDQLAITQERYQVIGTPTAYLIDPQGKLIGQYVGMLKEPDLKTNLRTVPAERLAVSPNFPLTPTLSQRERGSVLCRGQVQELICGTFCPLSWGRGLG
ncbi:Uncharacterised protein [Serratia fonticola]|uniref:Uncharacterized protein n=1 Tax=Serratia fonticola TaxID=47917 RepID=A0A4V6Z2U2_SERFO|nr:Uncharacterised protein [Serratia fonticola]